MCNISVMNIGELLPSYKWIFIHLSLLDVWGIIIHDTYLHLSGVYSQRWQSVTISDPCSLGISAWQGWSCLQHRMEGGEGGRGGEGEEPPHGPRPLQPALPHSEPGHCLENPWNKEGLRTTKSLKTRSNAATVIINLKRKYISVFYKLENNFTGKQKHYLLNQLFLQVEISNLQRMKWKRLTQDTKDKEDF